MPINWKSDIISQVHFKVACYHQENLLSVDPVHLSHELFPYEVLAYRQITIKLTSWTSQIYSVLISS